MKTNLIYQQTWHTSSDFCLIGFLRRGRSNVWRRCSKSNQLWRDARASVTRFLTLLKKIKTIPLKDLIQGLQPFRNWLRIRRDIRDIIWNVPLPFSNWPETRRETGYQGDHGNLKKMQHNNFHPRNDKLQCNKFCFKGPAFQCYPGSGFSSLNETAKQFPSSHWDRGKLYKTAKAFTQPMFCFHSI
jgi:hypothetical protein